MSGRFFRIFIFSSVNPVGVWFKTVRPDRSIYFDSVYDQFSRTSFSSLLHSSQELDRLLEREFDFLSPAEKDIIRIGW